MGRVIWMSAADGSWGGCDEDDLIVIDESEFTDAEFDSLHEAVNEAEVYEILMRVNQRSKRTRI
jgi:hypothetical protein